MGTDKGVKYFQVTYDDGDTEDIEHVAMRRVVRAMYKAQLETQEALAHSCLGFAVSFRSADVRFGCVASDWKCAI